MPTLNGIGKEAVVKHHKEMLFPQLEPVPELSCGDAGSGNLIVEGDNPHALKALLPRSKYYGTGHGDVAQLGERRVRNTKVGSSILLVSTKKSSRYWPYTLDAGVPSSAWGLLPVSP